MLILDEGKHSKAYKINIKLTISYSFDPAPINSFDHFLEFFLKKWSIILNKRKSPSISVVSLQILIFKNNVEIIFFSQKLRLK